MANHSRATTSKLFAARSTFAALLALRFSPGSISLASSLRASSRRYLSDELPARIRSNVYNFADADDATLPRRVRLLGTDADATLLRRAEAARYQGGSLKDLPAAWRDAAFTRDGEAFVLRPEFRRDVAFQEADIRCGQPDGPFDLVLCRNLVFTYFAPGLQETLQRAIAARLAPGGYLAIGAHERLPAETGDLVPLAPKLPIYRKVPAPA